MGISFCCYKLVLGVELRLFCGRQVMARYLGESIVQIQDMRCGYLLDVRTFARDCGDALV